MNRVPDNAIKLCRFVHDNKTEEIRFEFMHCRFSTRFLSGFSTKNSKTLIFDCRKVLANLKSFFEKSLEKKIYMRYTIIKKRIKIQLNISVKSNINKIINNEFILIKILPS